MLIEQLGGEGVGLTRLPPAHQRYRKHEVSVFLTQRSAGPIATVLPRIRSGFTIHSATTQDLRIVAVSDVNPADLDLLLSALEDTQSPR